MPDRNGFLLPNERRILLRKYAPVLVLFPEDPGHAPYPDDGDAIYTMRGSYHPRAVDLFLAQAKVRYRRGLLLRQPWLLPWPRSIQHEIERARESISRRDMARALGQFRTDPHYAGLDEDDLRAAIVTRLVQERLARRVRGFDLPGFRGNNVKQWRTYFRVLAEAEPDAARSVIYGRVVQGLAPLGKGPASPKTPAAQASRYGPYDVRQTRIALQYWIPYYYDDWANRHEGDWESITVLLELSPAVIGQAQELGEAELLASVEVQDVGYSSHEDGYRRAWKDVQKTADERPIVYVARGSSASYFAWTLEGYPTSARVGIVEKILAAPAVLVRGRRVLGRRWDAEFRARFTGRDPKNTDWVAADPQPHDRKEDHNITPQERAVPLNCRGVRRVPGFDAGAGLDDASYYLETDDTFWVEMVEGYGVMWGETFFIPGSHGPHGMSRKQHARKRKAIHSLAQIEAAIEFALDTLREARFVPGGALPELDAALRPLRPGTLRRQGCFPSAVRTHIYLMWASILRTHPEAWPGGPGLLLRWIIMRQPRPGPLLEREDPLYHIKSLLAQIRRLRYEVQSEGSKWDNPFAWVRYVCRADTFYYGMTHGQPRQTLDPIALDCDDEDVSLR